MLISQANIVMSENFKEVWLYSLFQFCALLGILIFFLDN